MPNYFYDLPEELQEMIYKEEHKMKMKVAWRGECALSGCVALTFYELLDSLRAVTHDDDIGPRPARHVKSARLL